MNLKKKRIRMAKNEGITLVALVITIVILIILATLSISATFGENGILTKVNDAKTETRGASVEEEKTYGKQTKMLINMEAIKQHKR